jgi:FSR family fosmidomycin resistance protein-like MFS transporter
MNSTQEGNTRNIKEILPIAGGHMFHDFFTAFLAPLLPGIIENLSLSLTSAGLLSTMLQIPSVLNPFFGYLADKKGARYFIIFSPAVTATMMSLLGRTKSPAVLALLLLLAGISSASLHAASPAVIGKTAENKTGLAMSLFMAGGGLGRTLSPLVVVWAISQWGLDGIYRLMIFGWAASVLLYFQFKSVDFTPRTHSSLRQSLPQFREFFLPLALVLLLRSFILAATNTYLPTYLVQTGASLALAGAALSAVELSGVAGGLVLGPLSDRFGRKSTIGGSMFLSAIVLIIFLNVSGWFVIPLLLIFGFFSRSTGSLFLALVQDNFRGHRATSNGVYMLISFLSNALMLVLVGFIGDLAGLRTAYLWSAGAAILSILAIYLLPKSTD